MSETGMSPEQFDIPPEPEGYEWDQGRSPNSVYPKLVKLMEKVGVIYKDKKNEMQGYGYASAEATLQKIQPALVELGLCTTKQVQLLDQFEIQAREKTVTGFVMRTIITLIDSETGDSIESQGIGCGMDHGDKAPMKAVTSSDKYAWWLLLNIPSPQDPEADAKSDSNAPATIIKQPQSTAQSGESNGELFSKVLSIGRMSEKHPFVITTEAGEFKTFDKNVIVSAEIAKASGSPMKFKYRVNQKFNSRDIISEKPKETQP